MKDALPPPDQFKNLDIPRKEIEQEEGLQYRVYSTAKEFTMVIAANAQEAISLSAVKSPLKVVRHMPMDCNVLEFPIKSVVDNGGAAKISASGDTVAEVAVVVPEDEEVTSAEVTAQALSNDDVEKLLGGDA